MLIDKRLKLIDKRLELIDKRLESHIILKSLGARKAKGLNQDGQIHGNFIGILATAVVDIKLDF